MSKKRSKDEDDVPSLPNPPSLIEYGDMRFLIFDAPSDDNVDVYAKVLAHHNVKVVARLCDPTYSLESFEDHGFEICVRLIPTPLFSQNFLARQTSGFQGFPGVIHEILSNCGLRQVLAARWKKNAQLDTTSLFSSYFCDGWPKADWPFNDGAAPPKEIITNWLALCKKTFKNPDEKATIGVHCVAGLGRAPILVTIALIEAGMDAIAAINLVRTKRRGSINRTQLQFLKKYKRQGSRCVVM